MSCLKCIKPVHAACLGLYETQPLFMLSIGALSHVEEHLDTKQM